MFNTVVGLRAKCADCGEWITDFQTKDAPYPNLNHVHYSHAGYFYSYCDNCNYKVEFELSRIPEESFKEQQCEKCHAFCANLDDFIVSHGNRENIGGNSWQTDNELTIELINK